MGGRVRVEGRRPAVRRVLWNGLFGEWRAKDGKRLKVLKAVSKLFMMNVENKAGLGWSSDTKDGKDASG